jgi:hypothetical protein
MRRTYRQIDLVVLGHFDERNAATYILCSDGGLSWWIPSPSLVLGVSKDTLYSISTRFRFRPPLTPQRILFTADISAYVKIVLR